ncbi:hypothetical protein CHLNCDRAFT_57799 [Chlorella variabilis]|uniref:LysM domain-containing protein n=1 Tax=Chlorella variabilis TaxID=554065 RepID=E1ZDU7_CHLVA|nr:hypothetical protein CHLNCDRAFT_57799 [Chlorella variabilis]EFN55918.1 hypothetical protein CHLNCDRAFT_57799 [Chlorella variabilis]|eukprot:XP_005848020.1 hypothetical protein CHLNCDRAFT_57799 [Chlorella variabilis]
MLRVVLALALGALAVAAQSTPCQTYVVQAQDTIGSIAASFNILQSDLESAQLECNSGYTPGGFLQLAQTLCLPPYYPACANVKTAGDNEACKYYTVQAGDTLSTIAAALNLPQLEVEAANPEATSLQVNDFVRLPGWSDVCAAPGDNTQCRVYVAAEGDSLASIAIAFSVDVAELQEANPSLPTIGDNNAVLQPGQRINIPPFTAACGDGVVVSKPTNCFGYQVEAGDALYDIATMFQTTTTLLVEANPELAAGGVLAPGSVIKLPPYDEATCVGGISLKPRPASYSPSLVIAGDDDAAPTGAPAPAGAGAPAPSPAFSRRRLI